MSSRYKNVIIGTEQWSDYWQRLLHLKKSCGYNVTDNCGGGRNK